MTFAFFLQNATAQITVTGSNTKDGPYTSLTNAGGAFEALNSITQVGKTIVITITADVTTESGTNALTGDAGMWSTLTINPSGVRTISGSSYYLIYLNGADNLTIDGLNTGGNSLTINNSSTNLDASTLYFDNDASNNVVTNCTILGSSSSSSTSATIMFGTTCPVTGNDNNNINHCNIGPSGDNLPGCALQYGGGTTEATANSGNTISYNNIYDWYSPTDSDYAIFFTSYYNNINCTITKNSFYQTAPRTKTSTSYFYSYAMYLNGPSSPSYTYGQTITDNYIGGSSPQCGGTPMSYNGAATGNVTFQPIFIKIGTATPTMIKNNTIKNISLTADGDVVLYPITVQTGACEIDNNTLGSSTATSNITLNSLTKGTKFFGIYNTGKATITSIDNNTIGGVTIDGNNGTTSYSNMFYGIYIWSTTSTIDDITNNHIGSTTIANSVSITNSTNVCRMVYIGISLSALTLGRRLVDGNTIANITIAKDATWSSVSYSSGIYSEAPDATISNNEIYNLKNGLIYQGSYVITESYAPVVGIYLNAASGTTTVRSNKIHGLKCTSTTSLYVLPITGIHKNGNGLAIIERNFIYGLSSDATTPAGFEIRGISAYSLASAANLTISNNIIMLGLDDTGNNLAHNHNYLGICLNYTSPRYIYFNTCYIGGTGITGSGNSKAYYQTKAAVEDIRNNIFHNDRTNSGATGKHYAISSGDATFTTCDYNDYYVSGTGSVLGQLNTTDKTSLASWQTTTSGDTHSLTTNPVLNSVGGILAANYMPSATSLVGITGTGITTDYDGGDARSVISPAMGAYEYTVSSCANPTSGGTIASSQTILSGATPSAFTSSTLPTGHTGTLEYKWQSSTTSSSTGFTDISSSNSATYAPGSITVTTWFKRLARVGCKSDWTGAAESNVLAITIPAAEPTAQATNLYFSNSVSGPNTNIGLNYTASASATSYLVVRKTGSAPIFVPVDGTAYATGAQGSDQVVYVGTALTCTDASIAKDLSYYFKVYAFNGSNESCNYLTSNPLDGNSICYAGASATMANDPGKPVSAGFPDQGINITFPNGTSGPTINASKGNTPSSNFSVLPGVRGVANLYFTITSTAASPGNYTLVLDFSSLALSPASKWNTFKILKRTDSSSAWKDITTLGGTIINRQTDGIPGKFTITGLSSFSDFAGGEENNTWTVTSPFETGEGSLKDLIAAATTLDGDVIIFNITTSDTINLSSPVVVDKNLTIRGVAGGIVLNGYYATRVLEIADTKVVRLENLKIHNGHSIDATGGGIWNNGDLTMINCVISGNQDEGADGVGGILQYSNGLDNPNDVLNLVNCTITENNGTAPNSTGTGGLISTGGVVNIYNSIIYGNIGGTNTDVEPASTIHEAWNSCFGNYANMTIESMDIANISDNPLFEGIVANPTHPYTLLSSSPCIDSGDDSYSFETTDIRGGTYSRKLDKSTGAEGTIDMGAYEYNINNYWSGATSTTWNDDTNWNSGKAPTSSDRIVIPSSPSNQPHVTDPATAPAVCLDLTIQSGAVVTVDAGKALSVSGNLTNFAGTSGLVVKSDDGGTGSLKILGSVSGSATVERNFSIDKWHLVSSPLASEPIITFLANNVDIATSDLASASHYEYAMSSYSAGSWSSFFLHDKSNLDLFGVGKGYRVLTSIPFTKTTYFEGTLNSLPVSAVPVELGWNLVGNPYTTALNINAGSTGFVSVNSALLPSSFAAVYFWDAATTAYIAVNNDFADTNAPIGQGFFVKAGSAGNITFNSDMQIHDGSNVFKSSSLTRPTITLKANNGIGTASTLIKFMDGAHEGLDVGYDAGIFKADAEFTVYTKLVEDNGVEFQLQYLPTNQYSKLVIPVGIDSKAGGEIVFTVQTVQLDPTCKVILEDKLTNTFTDLSKNSYKAAVVANTSTSERFFLHTGDIVSGLEDQVLPGKVTAYAKGNTEIRVIGEVGEGAVATLVNGLGQVVLTKKLGAGSLNIIGLPYLSSGVYLLNINDKSTSQTIKVMVRK